VNQRFLTQVVGLRYLAPSLTPLIFVRIAWRRRRRRRARRFPECGKLPPPVISFTDVAFSYSGRKEDYLFKDLHFGIDCDSRIALVGPNGAGKSTLLKLIVGEIVPVEGTISRRSGISLGRYHQHSADQLDFDKSPVQYLMDKFQVK
jgi:ATP-binding cassette, subfamily F, member 2